MPTKEIWHRVQGEPEASYAYFQRYLAQNIPRSIKRLADELEQPAENLYQYSSVWDWMARAAAFDDWTGRQTANALKRKIVDMNLRHQKLAESAQAVIAHALIRLNKMVQDPNQKISIDTLNRIVNNAKQVTALERTALGEAETITEHRFTDVDSAEKRRVDRILADPEIRIRLAEIDLHGAETGDPIHANGASSGEALHSSTTRGDDLPGVGTQLLHGAEPSS
jgi:hypothetical protein